MARQKPKNSKTFAQSGAKGAPKRGQKGGRARAWPHPKAREDRVQLFGIHAVEAALGNPARPVFSIRVSGNSAHRLAPLIAKRNLTVEPVLPKDLDRQLGPDTVHQGVLLNAGPLPDRGFDDIANDSIVLVLDQVTDPHNVGAALRSAAAFGASALVMTERHSPPLAGVLAKAASGALDLVPIVQVRNLAEALAELGDRGVMRIGLAEQAEASLEHADLRRPLALVLGAEGKGLRRLTRERCDILCSISTANALASLNVSNAAAIALHWVRLKAGPPKP
jgi:23S rRNA (guanosine2251-2'-O)-methyltransferase